MPSRAEPKVLGQKLREAGRPFLTVAIPHYKHRRYLEIVLQSVLAQRYDDFEIVVSDDQSPDDSNQLIPTLLQASGRPYRYYAQAKNLGYDGNVRFCISAAEGQYVLLLGNDDALTNDSTLASIDRALRELGLPDVAFTNYEDWQTGAVVRRAVRTQCLGSGPRVALRLFRTFSFVSGLLFKQSVAARHETDQWDQSIYYQMYLACRMMAAGGAVASIELSAIRKDVRCDGKTVANYVSKWSNADWSFQPRHTGLESVVRVTAAAVSPYLPPADRSAAVRQIVAQVLSISYSYWLFEYRRVANWSFSVGVARGLLPSTLLAEHQLAATDRVYLWLVYVGATAAGLTVPVGLFRSIGGRIAHSIRRLQQRGDAARPTS
jgi:hypothetical protein